jgi:hypothetical protein
MRTLADILLAEHQREALIADCVKVIERHLNGLHSLRGMALKGGLAVFRTAMPDVLTRVVRRLLPDCAEALEPLHQQFRRSTDRDFSLFLRKHEDPAVEALIGAADRRVAASSHELLRATYPKLRGSARAELQALLPQLAKTLSGYLD